MDKYSELARLLRKNGWEKQGGTNYQPRKVGERRKKRVGSKAL